MQEWNYQLDIDFNDWLEIFKESKLGGKTLEKSRLFELLEKLIEDTKRDSVENSDEDDKNALEKLLQNITGLASISLFSQRNDVPVTPLGIAVGGPKDNMAIFVTHNYPYNLVKKFAIDNDEMFSYWSSSGNPTEGKFYTPLKVALDKNSNVYVSDFLNNRIAKFTSEGKFDYDLGELGSGKDEFILPGGIAIDTDEDGNTFLYVVDMGNIRIHKFQIYEKSAESVTEGLWPLQLDIDVISASRNFVLPMFIAVDSTHNVYVVDAAKSDIKKFDSKGNYLFTFGKGFGDEDGKFKIATGIAIDNNDNIYIADSQNHRIQQFDTNGNFVGKFGSRGGEKSQFEDPSDLTTDADGNLYVSDAGNHRIQRIEADCIKNDNVNADCIITFGSEGSFPGQFSIVGGLAVTPDGVNIYATDLNNNRIQVFKNGTFHPGKAIIIAGRSSKLDNLWDAIQAVANFAYHVLLYQGFRTDEIQYLSADINLDSVLKSQNYITAEPTLANVEEAIKNVGNDNLTLYMVDHGGTGQDDKGVFHLNVNETLTSGQLNNWLNGKDEEPIFEHVKIIYDACKSGTFFKNLRSESGDNWSIITSASAEQDAYFDSQGSLSFSMFFWREIFNGSTIGEAFTKSSDAIKQRFATDKKQTPQFNKVFATASIGNGTKSERPGQSPSDHGPKITLLSGKSVNYAGKEIEIVVEVSDENGVNEVWATVNLDVTARGQAIIKLPTFYFKKNDEGQFVAKYNDFTRAGQHKITIYANDSASHFAEPKEVTVEVAAENLRKHQAVIVAGSTSNEENIQFVCNALEHKGFANINLLTNSDSSSMCNLTNGELVVPAPLTLQSFKHVLSKRIEDNARSLVIYFEGVENDDTSFLINQDEKLDFTGPNSLDSMLNDLQKRLQYLETVTVMIEGPNSGRILSEDFDKGRIVITSNGIESTINTRKRDIFPSFSRFFWQKIGSGGSIRNAFIVARKATGSIAQMDDNGNGTIGDDGEVAKYLVIGTDIVRANVAPNVNATPSWQAVKNDSTSATFGAKIISMEKLRRVWAVIDAPTIKDEINLEPNNAGEYSATYYDFIIPSEYKIHVFAEDEEGRISLPSEQSVITINQGQSSVLDSAQDIYQNGDTIKVELQSSLPEGYVQYVGVKLPDGRIFTIDNLNSFNYYDGKKQLRCDESTSRSDCWVGEGNTVIDIPVDESMPHGEYQLHLVRLPKGVELKLPPTVDTWGESFFDIKEK